MRYLSLFSGIGGLEDREHSPVAVCEIDPACQEFLKGHYPGVQLHEDVRTMEPPEVDVVAGGWPCQDISVAGLRKGLAGERSGLFFDLLRVARDAKAHTIIAENVPNLLTIENGDAFRLVLQNLAAAGFPNIAWRTLNARQFGLPHQRRRIVIVASQSWEIARALHRKLPPTLGKQSSTPSAAFYWTAGSQSICFSENYSPTLKVGSALSIPSPPAVFFGDTARKMSAHECLRLQGFDPIHFAGHKDQALYRMSGNAVAVPMGRFAMACVREAGRYGVLVEPTSRIEPDGYIAGDKLYQAFNTTPPLAANLADFLDLTDVSDMSVRAATGLLRRLNKSGKPCPLDLRRKLETIR